jgi:hypothetical protein
MAGNYDDILCLLDDLYSTVTTIHDTTRYPQQRWTDMTLKQPSNFTSATPSRVLRPKVARQR